MQTLTKAEKDKRADKINIAEALKLRYENRLTYQEIADRYGVSKQTIHQRLSTFIDKLNDVADKDSFDKIEGRITRSVKWKYYNHLLDDATVKASSANNAAYVIQGVNSVQRLNEGQSTENLSIKSITADLSRQAEELSKKKAELLSMMDEG